MAKIFGDAFVQLDNATDIHQPLRTLQTRVREEWTDYNGHMNEARYLDCFSNASDCLMQLLGCDQAYIAAGHSFFTVETHIVHMGEVMLDEPIYVTTQILKAEGKKLRIFHRLFHDKGNSKSDIELANCEQMLIHVDLTTRSASMPKRQVAQRMEKYGNAHEGLEFPANAGRAIGTQR